MLTSAAVLFYLSIATICFSTLAAQAADSGATAGGHNAIAVQDTPGKEHSAGRVTQWEHNYELRPGKWAQTDYNFEAPSQAPAQGGSSQGWGAWEVNPPRLRSLHALDGIDALFANSRGGDNAGQPAGISSPARLPVVPKAPGSSPGFAAAGGAAQASANNPKPLNVGTHATPAAPAAGARYHNPQAFQIISAGQNSAGQGQAGSSGPHVKAFSVNTGAATAAAKGANVAVTPRK